MENVLITGGKGYLASFLKKQFPDALAPGRDELDITNKEQVEDYFKKNKIDVVFHLAAIASIPKAEENKKLTYDVHVNGTRNLLNACVGKIKLFIYLNTACVFSGDEDKFYDEDDLPNPKHYYGLTKYIAEEVAKTYNKFFQVIITRTNFSRMPWPYQKAFTDRFGTYLFAEGVAKALKEIAIEKPKIQIIHICGDKKLSMYEYAKLGKSNVEKMTLNDYKGTALTRNMCLTTKYWKKYKIEDSNP
ncbi:MAG: sugar nucleotide-binding protein [Candidatus Woesearchaeota archaeon]